MHLQKSIRLSMWTSVLSLATSITPSSPWIPYLSFLITECAVAKTSKQDRHLTVINTRNLKGQRLGMKTQSQPKHLPQYLRTSMPWTKVVGHILAKAWAEFHNILDFSLWGSRYAIRNRKATLLLVGPLDMSPTGHAYVAQQHVSYKSLFWLWDRGECPPQRRYF
jgi:hypothetical protein